MMPLDDIFGQWTWDQMNRYIDTAADRERLPRDLVRAVIKQESNWDPHAVGDGGRAKGFFQLHPGAAKDAGIDPNRRDDIGLNIDGGTRYLRMKLDQAGGDVDKALRLYNGGGDPNYVANVRRHLPQGEPRQPSTMLSRAASILSPASAEAATPQQGASTAMWDDIFGAQPAPGQPPAPPTARSTPEQDAAYRAWAAQQTPGGTQPPGPVSQTAPVPTTAPAARQGPAVATPAEASATIARMRARQAPALERFLALPSIAQLTPAERAQVTKEFQALPADQQEQVIQLEVPGDLSQAMAQPPEARPRREGEPMRPEERPQVLPSQVEAPLEEGFTKPSTAIPLVMGGAGVKATQGVLGQVSPWIQRLARPVAEGLSQTMGWATGRTAETGQVPSAGEVAREAGLNIATGGLAEVPGAAREAKRLLLRTTPGAQTVLSHQAVQEAKGLGQRVFQAQDEAAVSKVFDDVARSGERLEVLPMQDYWTSLTGEERRIAMRELRNISPRYAAAMDNPYYADWDIGHLQDLRSHLLKAAQARRTPATQDLLMGMRSAVDDAITHGMAVGGRTGTTAEMLKQAQAAWRNVKRAQDLQDLVSKHTRDSPNLKWQELNLAALNKELRGGGTKAAKNLVGQMDAIERQALQQELDSLRRHYPFVQIPRQAATMAGTSAALAAGGLALTGNLPAAAAVALPAIVAAAARSPNIMSLFKRSLIADRGRLTPARVESLVNAIRHEHEGAAPSAGQP